MDVWSMTETTRYKRRRMSNIGCYGTVLDCLSEKGTPRNEVHMAQGISPTVEKADFGDFCPGAYAHEGVGAFVKDCARDSQVIADKKCRIDSENFLQQGKLQSFDGVHQGSDSKNGKDERYHEAKACDGEPLGGKAESCEVYDFLVEVGELLYLVHCIAGSVTEYSRNENIFYFFPR